ncbi:hypothetical protein HY418_02790 [Candidatus Kaiserbacteria bacterium]|nr:hypothetical protein [Candidatus Kaiserbacteria bacterium]
MLPYRDSRITKIALGLFFLLIIGYAYFEARGLLFGPSITVTSDVAEVHDPFITLQGHADRISALSMNGKAVEVTEDGAFSEPYLLTPGYNRIILDARDKYGRTSSQTIEIVYTPKADATPPQAAAVATSTESQASTSPTLPMAPEQ